MTILKSILPPLSADKDDANIRAAFCIAFAGFLRMGEFTNTATELAASGASPKVLRRSDISFSENHDTATLLLRRSKTDVNNTGVRIILARTGGIACPVASLLHLLATDPQDQSDTLFRFTNGPFTRTRVLSALSLGLSEIGIQDSGYSGHSFRRGAAQHASGYGHARQRNTNSWPLVLRRLSAILHALHLAITATQFPIPDRQLTIKQLIDSPPPPTSILVWAQKSTFMAP